MFLASFIDTSNNTHTLRWTSILDIWFDHADDSGVVMLTTGGKIDITATVAENLVTEWREQS
jgi:hypothetical protein